jgi:hypothetical protein
MFGFLLSIFLLSACVNNETDKNANLSANKTANYANENKIPPKDDVEELERTIKLPFHPEEATWRETDLNAAKGEKKITAVLKFLSEDANKIIAQAETYKPVVAVDIDAEDWFPAELIAQSQLSGDGNLKGKSYAANDFLQQPYTNGKITRIDDTDYFVLELTSF